MEEDSDIEEEAEDTESEAENQEDIDDVADGADKVEDTEDKEEAEAENQEETDDVTDDADKVEDAEDMKEDSDTEEEAEDAGAEAENREDADDVDDDRDKVENAENIEEDSEEGEEFDNTEVEAENQEETDNAEDNSTMIGKNMDVGDSKVDEPKEYHDVAEYNSDLNKLYSDKSMSNQEKVDAAKECVDRLNNSDLTPEEKRKSVDAPSDARALKNLENSDWTEKTDDNPWPPINIDFPDKMGLDFYKEITSLGREEGCSQLPQEAYRYGGEGGYNFTCKNAEGQIPSLDERSLPKEYVPEKDRVVNFDNDRYCVAIDAISEYENNPSESLDKINGIVDNANKEHGTELMHLEPEELEALSDTYKDLQDTEFADVRNELGVDDKSFTKYGVHGYAKPMGDANGDTICEGGAEQFNTALPEYMLKRIGVEY